MCNTDTIPLPPKPRLVVGDGIGNSLFFGGSLNSALGNISKYKDRIGHFHQIAESD